ncbi:MAG: alpha/beta hydrolase [Spirochaetales bacterium]|nr:alpha/beta hydrolase [Spirochaetales bacterium]
MRNKIIRLVMIFSIPLLFLVLAVISKIEETQITKKYPAVGAYVSAGDVSLHYLRKGMSNEKTLVLIHGRDGTLQEYTYSFFKNAAENFDVIAFDRPGYGYSDAFKDGDMSLKHQAEAIHTALLNLGVVEPVFVGHSYGGAVCLEYLLDYPESASGALLLGPAAYMNEDLESTIMSFPNIPVIGPILTYTILLPLGRGSAKHIYENAFAPEAANEEYANEMSSLYLRPVSFKATARELLYMESDVRSISPRYNEIKIPVVVMAGTEDKVVDFKENAEALVTALPLGKLVTVAGAGHKLHHSHGDLVIEELKELMQ